METTETFEIGQMFLIDLYRGNRYENSILVQDIYKITKKEMEKITDNQQFIRIDMTTGSFTATLSIGV